MLELCLTFSSLLPLSARGDKLGSAFAGILLMVSLHLLEGSKEDGRGEERCRHITDLVETYGRMSMSGSGTGGDEDDDEEEEDDDEDRNGGETSSVPFAGLPSGIEQLPLKRGARRLTATNTN